MFDLNEFAKEIHQNAVAHGWWEGERSVEEILALIHSEWSEALEEYRAGRPLVWHKCPYNGGMREFQEVHNTGAAAVCDACTPDKRKPEGIAVELIDGCIRILDFLVQQDCEFPANIDLEELRDEAIDKLTHLVCFVHGMTAQFLLEDDVSYLFGAFCIALLWVKDQGIDPFELMREKHEYNKTRPYKHGGKLC